MAKYNKKSYTNKNKYYLTKKVRFLALLFLIALIGFLIWQKFYKKEPVVTSTNTDTQQINYNPPTEEEKKQTEDQKKEIIESTPTTLPTKQDGRKSVKPTITSANNSEVRAYIDGIFKEGGTCTATYTKNETSITGTSKGFGNATYTSCEPISPATALPSQGGWSVKVTYASSKYVGNSELVKVTE